ncbi:MAG: hypothetical protein LAO79_19030 [Acidobacteriia bacterium]|nr:hypothetical protein [Terriglobia bacterium]
MRTIFLAGLICGILDGISAVALSGWRFTRVWQFVSSAIGLKSAPAGLALHFLVATTAASVFFLASRKISFLIDHALISGVLYGALVHLVMSQLVVPLSAIGRRPFVASAFLAQLAVHMIVVGPSIALTVRWTGR